MQEYRIGKFRGGFAVSWWEDGKRRRYSLEALTPKDAEREALDLIRLKTTGTKAPTTSEMWEAYLVDRAGRPIAETMRWTGKAVLAHFGALRPDQITTKHCRDYAEFRRMKGVQDGSIWTELGHLRSTLNWAVKMDHIKRAPYIERPEKPAPKERWLTREEIRLLLDAADQPHISLAIRLMLSTLARVGAALELTWDRVDLVNRKIDLRLESTGPRKGRAVVPMNAGLEAALREARKGALSDYVIEWAGGPVGCIRKGFTTAVTAAKLQDVTLHTLRHTGAVHMVAAGVPMHKISQFMGHSNTQVTERTYARFAPDHLRDAADKVDFD